MKTIARIHNDFSAKFGIPRQSGLVEALKATVVFEPEFRNPEAVRGLETFSYIWLIWEFSEAVSETWSPTVRPPRLGGNRRVGVFASRSPFRPSPLGLSSVKLEGIEQHPGFGPVLHISGADLMDGTPIYDIKPYIANDCHPDAVGGYTDSLKDSLLEVDFPEQWRGLMSEEKYQALLGILAHDPRPAYQNDPERIYGLEYGGFNIRFTVQDRLLSVVEVTAM